MNSGPTSWFSMVLDKMISLVHLLRNGVFHVKLSIEILFVPISFSYISYLWVTFVIIHVFCEFLWTKPEENPGILHEFTWGYFPNESRNEPVAVVRVPAWIGVMMRPVFPATLCGLRWRRGKCLQLRWNLKDEIKWDSVISIYFHVIQYTHLL